MTLPPGGDAPRGRRLAGAAVQVAGAAAGAVVLLLRVGRIPAWDSPYAEDNGEFLIGALRHPWRLLVPYAGYEQLGPRLIGQAMIAGGRPARWFAVAAPAGSRWPRWRSASSR